MDPHYNDIPVPVTQDKVLSILPIISGLMSAWGSTNIIHMVLSSNKRTPYRRILLGLSCSDLITSLVLPLHAFLVPADTSNRPWAIGNAASCSALGFFHQLNFINTWYSGMLSFYFLLTVKFGITHQDLARKYEPWMHIFAVGYPLITASLGAGFGVYDELSLGHGCWVTNFPKGCGCKEEGEEGNVCCLSPLIAWIFGGIPSVIIILVILVNNLMVYCHVRNTIRRSRRYQIEYSSNSAQSHSNTCTGIKSYRQQIQENAQDKRIQAVATQGFLYVAGFFIAVSPGIMLRVLESQNFHDEGKLLPLLIAQGIFMPMQGFFNCLIYARPSYLRVRSHFPDQSGLWAFRRALHGDRVQPKKRRSSVQTEGPTNYGDLTDRPIHMRDSTDRAINTGEDSMKKVFRVVVEPRFSVVEPRFSVVEPPLSVGAETPEFYYESEVSSGAEPLAYFDHDSIDQATNDVGGPPEIPAVASVDASESTYYTTSSEPRIVVSEGTEYPEFHPETEAAIVPAWDDSTDQSNNVGEPTEALAVDQWADASDSTIISADQTDAPTVEPGVKE